MIGSIEAMKNSTLHNNTSSDGKYKILRKLVRAVAISLPNNGQEVNTAIQQFFLHLCDLHAVEEAGLICLNIIDLHHVHLYGHMSYEELIKKVEDYIAS